MPLIVIVLLAQTAITPAGSPVGVPMPVAPVVVCVIGVSIVFTFRVGVDEAGPAVLLGFTVMVPVAFTPLQPLRGIL